MVYAPKQQSLPYFQIGLTIFIAITSSILVSALVLAGVSRAYVLYKIEQASEPVHIRSR